jgi:hypothetical protein
MECSVINAGIAKTAKENRRRLKPRLQAAPETPRRQKSGGAMDRI